MDAAKAEPGKTSADELLITRAFNAPRELVWKEWTDCAYMKNWWGPKGFTSPYCSIDLRVGGSYLLAMRSPERQDYWSTGVYRDIVAPKRIVATDSFADEKGTVVPASTYGLSPDFPLELELTVTFEEHDGGTTLTITHVAIPSGDARDNTEVGWNESLDKLAEDLRSA